MEYYDREPGMEIVADKGGMLERKEPRVFRG
jgi:hypothetical protein